MFILSIVGAVLLYFVYFYLNNRNRMHHWKRLPCKRSAFMFADAKDFIRIYASKDAHNPAVDFLERVLSQNKLHQREGVSAFWIGPTPMVNVFCPELAEKVLGINGSLERPFEYDFFIKGFGPGLFFSSGTRWRTRRKLLNPCFHMRILEDFLHVFDEQSRILVSKIEQRQEEEHIHVYPMVAQCTLDIVCETLMGVRLGAQKGRNLEYTKAVRNLGDFLNQRISKPWLHLDILFYLSQVGREFNRDMRTVHDFTKNIVQQRKEAFLSERREGTKTDGRRRPQTMLDLLFEMFFDGGQLNEEDIMDEVKVFVFAGHDTITGGVMFALYCLGLYPEVQGRLHDELEALFQGDETRAVTMNELRDMKYMDCVLKETQRIYPSSPIVGRKTDKDIEHKGFVIPSGTDVYVNSLSLHRQPDLFPDPEVFDPDRFLPENCLKRHPFAYIPFSAGPRICIGMKFAQLEMKVVVANIMRKFRVVSLDPRDQVPVKLEINLKPAEPMRLKFLPRTASTHT